MQAEPVQHRAGQTTTRRTPLWRERCEGPCGLSQSLPPSGLAPIDPTGPSATSSCATSADAMRPRGCTPSTFEALPRANQGGTQDSAKQYAEEEEADSLSFTAVHERTWVDSPRKTNFVWDGKQTQLWSPCNGLLSLFIEGPRKSVFLTSQQCAGCWIVP